MSKFLKKLVASLGVAVQVLVLSVLSLSIIFLAVEFIGGQIAVVSAVFAALAAMASWASVRLARQERLARERPYVLGFFDFAAGGVFVLILENFGNGPAFDIEVRFDPVPMAFNTQPLDELSLFANPIAFFQQGKKHVQIINASHAYLNSDQPQQVAVTVSYKDIRGKSYEDTLQQDFSVWSDATVTYDIEYYAKKTAEELKKIKEEIEKVRRGR